MSELAVTIPQSVIDQADASEEALKQASGDVTPVADDVTPAAEPPVAEPVVVTEEPAAEPPKPAEPIDGGGSPSEDLKWENRYKTLNGKYNAEVPRLHAELRQLREEMASLRTSRLQVHNGGAVEPAPVAAKPGALRHLKDEEVAEVNADPRLDVISRMTRGVAEEVAERADARMAELNRKINDLESQLARTSGESYWDRVDAEVPGSREMNKSDALWHSFLNEADPVSGLTYRDIGTKAIRDGNVKRMVNLISIFRQVYDGAADGNTGNTDKGTVPVPVAKPVGSRRPTQAPPAPVPKTYKESEVQKFYADVTRGAYKGREKEAEALEAEYDLALNEGRIIP